jgi:hypothetical protein
VGVAGGDTGGDTGGTLRGTLGGDTGERCPQDPMLHTHLFPGRLPAPLTFLCCHSCFFQSVPHSAAARGSR